MSHPTGPRQLGVGVTLLSRAITSLTRPWALALLWLLVVIYAARFVMFKLPTPPAFTDFNHYYVASVALRMGSNPYRSRYDALATSLGLNLSGLDLENQPPTLLLLFEPLTRLGPHTAYWIWICISFVTLVIALCLLLRDTALNARQALLFGALLFLYPPVYEHFYFANFQIVISLLIVIAIFCMRRGADRWGGLWLALATALKAFPVMLAFYLLCRNRWRALSWMVMGGVIIGLFTLWDVGLVSLSFLSTFGFTTSRRFLEVPAYFSVSSVVSRLFWHGNVPLSPSIDTMRRIVIAVAELAVFVLTVSATAEVSFDRCWRAFSLWVTAMILLSPIAEPHYLVMLMVPFASVADAAAQGEADSRAIYAAVASYLVAFSRYPLMLLHHEALGSVAFFRIANQFWFLAMLLAYLAAYWLATSRNGAQHDTDLVPAAAGVSDYS
jgi:hypothetical protein